MRRALAVAVAVGAVLIAAGCGGGGRGSVMQGGTGTLHRPHGSTTAVIGAAHDANYALFLIFPGRPGKERCEIPTGGLGSGALRGTCQTSVTYPVTHGYYAEAFVRFRETWGSRHSSSWTVIVQLPADKVVATELHGDVSPQMRYAAEYKTPANQDFLDRAASFAQTIAGRAHVFTGVAVDDKDNKTLVWLHHAPASVLAKLRSAHPGIYVIHNDAPRTLRDVMRLQAELHWPNWKKRGIVIVQSGPTQTGYLQVGVSSSVQKAQAAFDAKYGRGVICVIHAEPGVALVAVARSSG